MKHSMLALAMLGLTSGLAHAQSNVTIYGTIDSGLRNQTNTTAAGDSKLSVGSNGTYLANRLGFTGTEDLGDGLNAKFVLESGFNTGTGALDNTTSTLFNRTAAVAIAGKSSSLSLGRQYTIAFQTAKEYEPFTYRYISLIPVGGGAGTTLPTVATTAGLGASATGGTRFNNDIQYSATFGSLTAMAEYAAGEQAGSISNGAAQAVALRYNEGPLNFGGAYTKKKTTTGFDNSSYTIGGGYQFGAIRTKLGYAQERQDSLNAGTFRNQLTWGGIIYSPTSQIELIAAWYNTKYSNVTTGKRDLFITSVAYFLSKRTRLYADIDKNRYTGALIPTTGQTNQTGISVGIHHSF
ncbi:porin [Undibacterium sp. SXout7W]|uniref:porin n=1 Tax=Undibacterium sp. SXout7W TaxID=3413049 RepID=UPI003BF2648D